MKCIRRNIDNDFIDKENKYVIYDNLRLKKYIILKKPLIDMIFKLTMKTALEEDVKKICNQKGFAASSIEIMINKLIENNILENIDVPITMLKNEILPELQYSPRYGLQIASFKKYETENYSRFDIFENIKNTELIIVGLGGAGSAVAILASAFGIGRITLIDGDIVEESNLTRQLFFKESDYMKKKVNSLKKYINEFNSEVEVNAVTEFIKCENDARKYIKKVRGKQTIVIQTANEPMGQIQYFLNKVCVDKRISIIFFNTSTVGPFYIPKISGCYECLKGYLDDESNEKFSSDISYMKYMKPNTYSANALGTWGGTYLLFNEIFTYLMGQTPKSANALLQRDFSNKEDILSIKRILIPRKRDCICEH